MADHTDSITPKSPAPVRPKAPKSMLIEHGARFLGFSSAARIREKD